MALPDQPVIRDAAQSLAGTLRAPAAASLTCDVSFVSDESAPADAIISSHVQQFPDQRTTSLHWTIFDRLRATYDSGAIVSHPACVMSHIRQALAAATDFDETQLPALLSFFDRINGVLFQQQTLAWLADAPFKLHLYGTGWENHPTLARFARGHIESDAMRLAIHRATRINLAASVYGALDARVTEGISTGGFFLMRYCPADVIERIFPPLWAFSTKHQITTNAQLREMATPAVRSLLDFASRTIGIDVFEAWPNLVAVLQQCSDAGYTQSAAAIWPQYPAVTFSARDELIGLVSRYLYDVPLRQRTADQMRKQLASRFEHVRINRSLANPRSEVAA